MEQRSKTNILKAKRDSFVLDGYIVKFIDGQYRCNGISFRNYKQLKFSVNYFNKKLNT